MDDKVVFVGANLLNHGRRFCVKIQKCDNDSSIKMKQEGSDQITGIQTMKL